MPKPSVASALPNQSNFVFASSSLLSGTCHREIISTISASGTLIKNTARHETCSISQPPKIGPMLAVIAVKADHVPIAFPRFASSKEALMMARLPGTSNAPPMPCAARATIRSTDALRQTATDRRKREESDADAEDAPPAETVAQRSAGQKQSGEKERVRFNHPL